MAKNQNQPFLGVIKTPPVKNEHVRNLILPKTPLLSPHYNL